MKDETQFVGAMVLRKIPSSFIVYKPIERKVPDDMALVARKVRERNDILAVWWGEEYMASHDGLDYVCMDFLLPNMTPGVIVMRFLDEEGGGTSCQ